MSNTVRNLISSDLINGLKDRAPIAMHIIALTKVLTIQMKRRYRELSDAAMFVHICVNSI
jgi:hypothetical protein